MNILAIESSCDETAVAILDDKKHLLSNVVVSQVDIFKNYGGVIPEIAARSHLEAILPALDTAFKQADLRKNDQNDWSKIDAIAVTHTPGLLGSLLIGTLTARTLAILHNKPLYPIHHLKSHIYSNWLDRTAPSFPILSLVISGGHTQIIKMTSDTDFEIIGTTLDDAVGECFDKIAKILGLPYPGGPSISNAALGFLPDLKTPGKTLRLAPGNRQKYLFPHPKTADLDFSFSGLKTAVLRTVQKEVGVDISFPSTELKNLLTPEQIVNFAASFEQTAVDILLEKLQTALNKYPDTASLVFAGGVSANGLLRAEARKRLGKSFGATKENSRNFQGAHGRLRVVKAFLPDDRAGVRLSDEKTPPEFSPAKKTPKPFFVLHFPDPRFTGDNAAMVAMAALSEINHGVPPTDPYKLDISPRSAIY